MGKTIYKNGRLLVRYEPERSKFNPYRIYSQYDGRTRKLTEYADEISALHCLIEIYREAVETMTFNQQKAWIKERTI